MTLIITSVVKISIYMVIFSQPHATWLPGRTPRPCGACGPTDDVDPVTHDSRNKLLPPEERGRALSSCASESGRTLSRHNAAGAGATTAR